MIQKLKEIGLTEEEIKRIKGTRWLLEFCEPTDLFLLKLAYLVKTKAIPLPKVVKGYDSALLKLNKIMRNLLKVYAESCQEEVRDYMKRHFDKFLHITEMDYYHFITLADSILSLKEGWRIFYGLSDFSGEILEEKDVFMVNLYTKKCGVLWLQKKSKIWIYAGEVEQGNVSETMERILPFIRNVFTSEWWRRIEDIVLENYLDLIPSNRKQKIDQLMEIKEWFDLMEFISPYIKIFPIELHAQILAYYSILVEEYMNM